MTLMRLLRTDVQARAIQRGYELANIEPCFIEHLGDGLWLVDVSHEAYPHASPGLGDMVKATLSAVGITEERVSKAIGRPCNCGKRAEKLNELGRRIGIG